MHLRGTTESNKIHLALQMHNRAERHISNLIHWQFAVNDFISSSPSSDVPLECNLKTFPGQKSLSLRSGSGVPFDALWIIYVNRINWRKCVSNVLLCSATPWLGMSKFAWGNCANNLNPNWFIRSTEKMELKYAKLEKKNGMAIASFWGSLQPRGNHA